MDSALAPSSFETDGGKYGWEDLRVDGLSIRLPASSAPTWTNLGSSALYGYAFAPAGGEYAYFMAQLPHAYVKHTANSTDGGTPYWHLHFTNYAGQIPTGSTVGFRLTYRIGPVTGGFTSDKTVDSTYTASATVAQNYSLMTNDVVLTGSYNYGASTIVIGRIERLPTEPYGGTMTYSGKVILLSTDFHLKVNRIGSSLKTGVR